jgi:hypothetical protein
VKPPPQVYVWPFPRLGKAVQVKGLIVPYGVLLACPFHWEGVWNVLPFCVLLLLVVVLVQLLLWSQLLLLQSRLRLRLLRPTLGLLLPLLLLPLCLLLLLHLQ